MSIDVVSPLRQRMIEDMTARKLSAGTQRLHISSCKRFAAFLQRSPETATVEDVRRFQLHLAETGTSIPNRNRLMTGLRFLFRVTLRRLDLATEIYHIREPQKIPLVMSPDETIGDGRRQSEDDMEVADRQQLRLTLGEPLLCRCALAFWAVPVAAAIVGDDGVRAVLASRDVAAKRRGAAALDCAHHLHLVEADVPGIGSAPRRPVVAEDVRDLQHWTGHSCQPLRRQLGFPAPPGLFARLRQQIKRALDAGDHAGGDARVARRGV